MSDHSVRVVPVVLEPHPNADSLSIVRVGGFQCVVKTDQWQSVDRAAYCAPDTLVPLAREEFAFLRPKDREPPEFYRLKAIRLRGEWSEGLLVPCSADIGADVTTMLGCDWYNPPEPGEQHRSQSGQYINTDKEEDIPSSGPLSKYDVENLKRLDAAFVDGERVFVTEKLHGSNGRFHFDGTRFWCGSRSQYVKDTNANPWWTALHGALGLQELLRDNQHLIAFGEVIGTQGPGWRYGCAVAPDGKVSNKIAVFDFFDTQINQWVRRDSVFALCDLYGAAHVPVIAEVAYAKDAIKALVDGPSLFHPATKIREGIVVTPANERYDFRHGRVMGKLVSNDFYGVK